MDFAFRRAIAQARQQEGLYFASLLSEDRILNAFGIARWLWQGWIYTPAVTVWTFLAQCMSPDHSCREAVAGVIAWRLAAGLKPCSGNTGSYCIARDAVPEAACVQLMRETGRQTDEQSPPEWKWHGHRVLDVDGSTITMPDTPENQAEYPQHANQKPGCGFPIARILVVFSLAVGTVLEALIRPYQGKQTGENSMFRELHVMLQEGDIALADRYFSGWFDIALMRERQAHAVIRKHQARATDFRRGQRLGKNDQIVVWQKPQRPSWMSEQEYEALPESLTMREVRVKVHQQGFRTRVYVIVTTLLDAKKYSAEEMATLYRRRWQAELKLRSLKVVLQMDHLRCKKPHRARNEFYMHMVAYNLIRQVMAVAAARAGVEPWTVSFKGTLQTLSKLLPMLETKLSTDCWIDALLNAIALHEVGNRPDRVEPRVKKRRPKPYPWMQKPRDEYRNPAA